MDLGDPQVLINDALRGRNAALITAKGQGSERKSEKRRKWVEQIKPCPLSHTGMVWLRNQSFAKIISKYLEIIIASISVLVI